MRPHQQHLGHMAPNHCKAAPGLLAVGRRPLVWPIAAPMHKCHLHLHQSKQLQVGWACVLCGLGLCACWLVVWAGFVCLLVGCVGWVCVDAGSLPGPCFMPSHTTPPGCWGSHPNPTPTQQCTATAPSATGIRRLYKANFEKTKRARVLDPLAEQARKEKERRRGQERRLKAKASKEL